MSNYLTQFIVQANDLRRQQEIVLEAVESIGFNRASLESVFRRQWEDLRDLVGSGLCEFEYGMRFAIDALYEMPDEAVDNGEGRYSHDMPGMTLDEFQTWSDKVIREVKDSE